MCVFAVLGRNRTIATAMIYPTAKLGRGNKDEARTSANTAGLSERRLRDARAVLSHSPMIARAVLPGAKVVRRGL
jgi:hypothetical protein